MTDLERILPLWRELQAAGADYVLTTVVAVEGPSYRKPGAVMLITADGRRAGTVSGGCLEAEVVKKAWWLTANGPIVKRYSTADDDGERPYGSGCGGAVLLLMERSSTAGSLLSALDTAYERRIPLAVTTVVDGPHLGRRAVSGLEQLHKGASALEEIADSVLSGRKSIASEISVDGVATRVWADYRPARTGLWIYGSGDDAQPLVRLAKELGWFVSVADGRSNLATRERFPLADELRVLPIQKLDAQEPEMLGALRAKDCVVVMSHSFEQDSRVLATLLGSKAPLAYIGVLGPQRRTRELLVEAAALLDTPADAVQAQTEEWLSQLHAPTGLDLGADSPESIALSVMAEIQKSLTAASALPLRQVRAAG